MIRELDTTKVDELGPDWPWSIAYNGPSLIPGQEYWSAVIHYPEARHEDPPCVLGYAGSAQEALEDAFSRLVVEETSDLHSQSRS